MLTITFCMVAASPNNRFMNVYFEAPSSIRSTSVKMLKFMSCGSSSFFFSLEAFFLGGLLLLLPYFFALF
jgi:VIT1/CCC1 family predicted Fe2+/Mn2+ transporter